MPPAEPSGEKAVSKPSSDKKGTDGKSSDRSTSATTAVGTDYFNVASALERANVGGLPAGWNVTLVTDTQKPWQQLLLVSPSSSLDGSRGDYAVRNVSSDEFNRIYRQNLVDSYNNPYATRYDPYGRSNDNRSMPSLTVDPYREAEQRLMGQQKAYSPFSITAPEIIVNPLPTTSSATTDRYATDYSAPASDIGYGAYSTDINAGPASTDINRIGINDYPRNNPERLPVGSTVYDTDVRSAYETASRGGGADNKRALDASVPPDKLDSAYRLSASVPVNPKNNEAVDLKQRTQGGSTKDSYDPATDMRRQQDQPPATRVRGTGGTETSESKGPVTNPSGRTTSDATQPSAGRDLNMFIKPKTETGNGQWRTDIAAATPPLPRPSMKDEGMGKGSGKTPSGLQNPSDSMKGSSKSGGMTPNDISEKISEKINGRTPQPGSSTKDTLPGVAKIPCAPTDVGTKNSDTRPGSAISSAIKDIKDLATTTKNSKDLSSGLAAINAKPPEKTFGQGRGNDFSVRPQERGTGATTRGAEPGEQRRGQAKQSDARTTIEPDKAKKVPDFIAKLDAAAGGGKGHDNSATRGNEQKRPSEQRELRDPQQKRSNELRDPIDQQQRRPEQREIHKGAAVQRPYENDQRRDGREARDSSPTRDSREQRIQQFTIHSPNSANSDKAVLNRLDPTALRGVLRDPQLSDSLRNITRQFAPAEQGKIATATTTNIARTLDVRTEKSGDFKAIARIPQTDGKSMQPPSQPTKEDFTSKDRTGPIKDLTPTKDIQAGIKDTTKPPQTTDLVTGRADKSQPADQQQQSNQNKDNRSDRTISDPRILDSRITSQLAQDGKLPQSDDGDDTKKPTDGSALDGPDGPDERYLTGAEVAMGLVLVAGAIANGKRKRADEGGEGADANDRAVVADLVAYRLNEDYVTIISSPSSARATWLINVGETLTGLAERFYDDARVGYLIADINSAMIKETLIDEKRIVEVNSRQMIYLPNKEDLKAFYLLDLDFANPELLVTIVAEREFDRQLVQWMMARAMGVNANIPVRAYEPGVTAFPEYQLGGQTGGAPVYKPAYATAFSNFGIVGGAMYGQSVKAFYELRDAQRFSETPVGALVEDEVKPSLATFVASLRARAMHALQQSPLQEEFDENSLKDSLWIKTAETIYKQSRPSGNRQLPLRCRFEM